MVISRLIRCLVLIVAFWSGVEVTAQCISFARNIARPQLEPFTHDGNFNATYMEEGESAELYKTFFEGEEYRLVVSAVESLPELHIQVLDEHRHVVFDNKNYENAQVWDFTAETTGTMIVFVRVPDRGMETITGGCVALLFGVKSSGGSRRR
ncbi:hypothetical protein CDL62_17340 [Alkalitalea saponilacus]|uniref:Uncharacterized protein n=1 Tax=Alkalitalea saponilacus TaxID=889453 RepID=A0A1T5HAY6_9BACT|nr:hypothetical protein [Alkalitalea saponilacus]ASB50790.1 hypothetical protein CDL62_17340 [Alkalitalea saponilacus]SKC17842.1 hypothetical protein SAMN03080601_02190 [Alkalitalea saponilacus]